MPNWPRKLRMKFFNNPFWFECDRPGQYHPGLLLFSPMPFRSYYRPTQRVRVGGVVGIPRLIPAICSQFVPKRAPSDLSMAVTIRDWTDSWISLESVYRNKSRESLHATFNLLEGLHEPISARGIVVCLMPRPIVGSMDTEPRR